MDYKVVELSTWRVKGMQQDGKSFSSLYYGMLCVEQFLSKYSCYALIQPSPQIANSSNQPTNVTTCIQAYSKI